MMVTWAQILGSPVGDPVNGDPAQFEWAASLWGQATRNSQTIEDEFAKIKAGASTLNCEGLSVNAIVGVIDRFHGPIDDLHQVCCRLESLMSAQRTRLEELRAEAARALAQAEVHWNNSQRLQGESAAQTVRLKTLQTQIDQMQLHPDPSQDAALAQLELQANATSHALFTVKQQLAGAAGGVADARRAWQSIRAREDEQDGITQRAIHAVDLGNLKDPGFWDRVFKDIEGVVDFCADIVKRDFAAVLWKLHDVLDFISTALTIVGLAVCVLAFFIPGVNLVAIAAIGLCLAVATASVDLAKLKVDEVLYTFQIKNPKTGKTISATELVFDVIGVVGDAFDVKGAIKGFEEARAAAPLVKRTWKQSWHAFNDQGVIDGRFTTVRTWTKLTTETGLTREGVRVVKLVKGVGGFVVGKVENKVQDELNSYFRRSQPITSQTQCVSGYRRISAPVLPVFLPMIAA